MGPAPSGAGRRGCARNAWSALAVAVALVLGPGSAWAAQVLDVRVGRHEDFTRIVFELNEPAGYQIERDEPSPGVSELVVTLEAGSASRRVQTPRSLVEGVSLDSLGSDNSVAHIRLRQDDLRLKEMILSNPPRIVLDLLPPEAAKTAAAPSPRAEAKKSAPAPAPKTAPAPTPKQARAESAPAPAAKPPAPKPAPRVTAPSPMDAPASAAPAPLAPRVPSAEKAEAPEPLRAAPPAPATGRESPTEAAAPPAPAERAASQSAPPHADQQQIAMAEPPARPEPPRAVSPSPEPPRASTPRRGEREAEHPARPVPPPARRATDQGGSAFGVGTLGLAAAGMVLVALGFLWLRRRRSESFEEGEEAPFEGLGGGGDAEQSESDPFSEPESAEVSDLDEVFAAPAAPAQGTPPARAEGASMTSTTPATDATTNRAAKASSAPSAGRDQDEVMRLVRELERRVSNLETRLDEAIDAKERLERQVAAQTEELRVQRAAIARTQRAVRSLSRPDEDHATEPALRDGEGSGN